MSRSRRENGFVCFFPLNELTKCDSPPGCVLSYATLRMSHPRRIGRCIYCLTSQGPLKREHIIPHGLIPEGYTNSWVLQAASCEKCEGITSAFEGHILGAVWPAARSGLNLRTRRNKPDSHPLLIERDGIFEEVLVPVEEYPAVIMFPGFRPPAWQDGREYVSGVEVISQLNVQVAGPPLKEVAKRYGTKQIRFVANFKGHSFLRLIAKIAYGTMVADFGLDGFEETYVLPAIMGTFDDIGRWVGCDGERKHRSRPLPLHTIGRSVVNGEVISRVSLFAKFGAPEYVVVVGRLRPNAQAGRFQLPRS